MGPSFFFSNIYYFIYLAVLGLICSTWDLQLWHLQLWHVNSQLQHVGSSSLTRDGTWAPGIGSSESQPLGHQGRPCQMTVLHFSFYVLLRLLLLSESVALPCTWKEDLPLEKSLCRSGSNSYNWTWNNRLVPNRKRSTSRPYIVSLLI